MIRALALCVTLACIPVSVCSAEPPSTAPASQPARVDAPLEFSAIDRPNDAGQAIVLSWRKMPYEGADISYEMWMAAGDTEPLRRQVRLRSDSFRLKSDFPSTFGLGKDTRDYHAHEVLKMVRPNAAKPGQTTAVPLTARRPYRFKLVVLRGETVLAETATVSAKAHGNWFAWDRLNVMVAMIFASAAILFCVWLAKRKPDAIFVRRIPGLEAVDEAIGRATEMGKSIYFCHGLGDVGLVVTVSAVNLLGKISERVAEYGADMKVTCFDYLVQQVSQEKVKEAYVRAGRPDAYREDNIFFVSDQSFAYATAVEGMLLRDKPATCFFFGQFMAEALLLAETGAITKAIQVAGTDNWTQIPFFITTCDYTLIGEELYAASAYLSREPRLLGAVKGQDAVKSVIIVAIAIGASLAVFGIDWLAKLVKVLS